MANQIKSTFIPPIGQRLGLSIAGGISTTLLVALYYFNMLVGSRLAVCASGNDGRISQ